MSDAPGNGDRPPARPAALRRFGEYFLINKLARGGMAEIFLAKRVGVEGFEKNVVIKRMLPHMSEDPDFVTMFLDEARLAAKLIHPNIAQVTDFGIADGCYFICMEYLPGEDLATIIRRCRETKVMVPVDFALGVAVAVCEGLSHAHDLQEGGRGLNIVHRDVSPSNVMVSYQGAVKLVDFGIAKATTKLNETRDGKLKGKAVYMSPEQVRGLELDGRADLFSLGLLLHELLTHQRIFRRDSELAVLRAVLEDPVPSPRQFRPDLLPALEAVIMKALARERDERFSSAAEMRAALEACITAAPGGSEARRLATFMVNLFGRERMELKTRVPSLAELDRDAAAATGMITPASQLDVTGSAAAHGATGRQPGLAPTGDSRETRGLRAPTRPDPLQAPVAAAQPRHRLWPLMAALLPVVMASAAGGAFLMRTVRPGAPAPRAVARPDTPAPTVAADAGIATAGGQPVGGPADRGARSATSVAPPVTEPTTGSAITGEKQKGSVKLRHRVVEQPVPLTPQSIATAIGGARASLLACFQKHRDVLSSDEGQVTLALVIQRSGEVKSAQVTIPGVDSSPLSACIVKQVRQVHFPPHTDTEVRVNVPFVWRVTAR